MKANNKKRKPSFAFAGLALALIAVPAVAEESVTINGQTYTCTNSCNVTFNNDGSYTVTDCCGGRVSARYEHNKEK